MLHRSEQEILYTNQTVLPKARANTHARRIYTDGMRDFFKKKKNKNKKRKLNKNTIYLL